MAFIRAFGGGGIPSALKSAMNAVLNKKFGTSTTYPPTGWPDDVNLLGPLPEKTASGSIAHIEDGADTVPIKSWDVTADANLDGVSSIKVTQAGKNLADFSTFVDGYVNTNGTFNTNHPNGEMRSDFIPVKPNTQYYFSIIDTTGTAADWVGIGEYTTNSTSGFIRRDSLWRFTTSPTAKYIVISSRNLAQATAIQLEVSYDPTSYEPYTAPTVTTVSFGRTIYGGNADVVNGTGTETYNVIRLDSLNFIKNNTQNNPNGTYFSLDGVSVPFLGWGSGGRDSALSNVLTPGSTGAGGQTEANNTFWWNNASTGWRVVWGSPNGGSSLDDFMTFLTENNVVVGGALQDAEKTDFAFSPMTPIPDTALGVNNFWADEGDSEVTYRADINLALAANSSRGLMMASRSIPEDEILNENTEEVENDEDIRQDPADR